jgi:hypothetical protein
MENDNGERERGDVDSSQGSWLPAQWQHPAVLRLATGHHLRPIRESDLELDYPAVMGSRESLWATYGEPWGWPPATMTVEQDREDLAYHADEIAQHRSFNYAVFDEHESELLGCVYIDPPEKPGADAEISWWVVDSQRGLPLEVCLDEAVPAWIAREWPFQQPRYIGRDLSWAEWMALPALEEQGR